MKQDRAFFLNTKKKKNSLFFLNFNFLKINQRRPNFCFKTGKYKSCFKDYMLSRHSLAKSINTNKFSNFTKNVKK